MSIVQSSDFNLTTVNTKEFAEHLGATIDIGGNLLAIARRGTGKTTIAQEVIRKKQYREVYFNLSTMERPDIGGYPNFFGSKQGEKFINFLMPSIYRDLMEGDQPCVATLDEVDKADSALLAPLLEFIQFRTINGVRLKNLRATVLTGNLPGESGQRPPLPLLDRVEKFLVEINPRHWLDWGAETGQIHPSISAYISDNPKELCGEIDSGADVFSDKSPRTWHAASKSIWYGENNGWSTSIIKQKVSAHVGKEAGMKYASFFEHYQVLLPMVERILNDQDISEFSSFEHTKKLVICMILCSRFASRLDLLLEQKGQRLIDISDENRTISNNIAKFLSNIDPDIVLMSVRGQIGMKRFSDHDLLADKGWDRILGQVVDTVKIKS